MVVGRTILSPAMGLCTLADANIEICMSYTQVQGFDVGTPDQMWTFFHFGVKSPKNERVSCDSSLAPPAGAELITGDSQKMEATGMW